MFGIPFTIRRCSENGVEDQVVYLRTRRRGSEGEKMRKLLGEYHDLAVSQAVQLSKIGAIVGRSAATAAQGGDLEEAFEALNRDQEQAMFKARACARDMVGVAENIAELALGDNYPREEAEKILDGLTDHDLAGIVSTVEQGSMPKDFFGDAGTPPKPSTTGRSGASPAEGS